MKTKFKLISFALVILLSLTGLPSDIVTAAGSGEILKELGILKGDLNGNLLLDQPLKRQDAIVLLSRLLGVEELAQTYPGEHSFSDVTNPYYDPFIAWAEESGLTEGVGGGLFGFDQYLKNQQLLAFLLRALGYEFYGDEYSLVPGKSVELGISPDNEMWSETTTRQLMADRTVELLRKGRVKYGNITLERSLALGDDSVSSNGQLFQLEDFNYKKGSVVLTFSTPSTDHNSTRSTRSTLLNTLLDNGPSVDDIELTYMVPGSGHVTVLKLTQVFYDPATGQMLATYLTPDIPTGSTVELKVTYLENRETVAHEAAHVVQQKSSRTYEPGEIQLTIEDILRNILPSFSGTFSSDEFNNDELKPLARAMNNPYFQDNSLSGEMTLISNPDNSIDIYTEVSVLENVATPDPSSLFIYLLLDGERLECNDCITVETDGRKFKIEINNLQPPEGNNLQLVSGYIKIDDIKGELKSRNGISDEELREFLEALVLNVHLSTKPDSLTSVNVFGRLTLNLDSYRFRPIDGKNETGVIVGTETTNPELNNEIIVSLHDEEGNIVLKTFKIHDYGDEFIDESSAAAYFSRYLDDDSDGDGLGDLVFKHKEKPVVVSKPMDKSTPLLMAADGGLGEHVNLHLENGEVMFWYDGIDNDCDGAADDRHLHTTTYLDSVSVDKETSSLRTGRNPQTGKDIKISPETIVVISEADGSVKTISPEQFLSDFNGDSSPDFTKIVADNDSNAMLIHVVRGAVFVYIDRKELDKSSTKVLYTNTDDLTEEEINYLISNEHDIELFVYRQEFGPAQGSSYRLWVNKKMAEAVDYSPEGAQPEKVARFKAGKALADTVKSSDSGAASCNAFEIGESPEMHSFFIKWDGVDGESKAVIVSDPLFNIFSELSVDFRGHVTVLK